MLNLNAVNGRTRVCGLIGDPVGHTMSPMIHNMLSELTEQNLVYVPFHVSPERLGEAVAGAAAMRVLGLNVTVPHKRSVMPYLEGLEETARAIGAVNTLVRTEDGTGFRGANTDVTGLARALSAEGIVLQDASVILLGAGGAARAAAYLCVQQGARRVWILNRTAERAQALAEEMNRSPAARLPGAQRKKTQMLPLPLSEFGRIPTADGQRYLAIQCTSVGLSPHADRAAATDEAFYRMLHTGFDLIYTPLQTRFMQLCEAAGARSCNGLKMLLYQAVSSFELWTGAEISDAQADAVYRALVKEMSDR